MRQAVAVARLQGHSLDLQGHLQGQEDDLQGHDPVKICVTIKFRTIEPFSARLRQCAATVRIGRFRTLGHTTRRIWRTYRIMLITLSLSRLGIYEEPEKAFRWAS